MRGAIPLLPQYVFMAWCLVKHRDNFTLPFTFTLLHGICYSFHNTIRSICGEGSFDDALCSVVEAADVARNIVTNR
jgi:hypothetical protein